MQSTNAPPLQLKRDQITPGTWYPAHLYLPPAGLNVLAAAMGGNFWVDWTNKSGDWVVERNIRFVAWQLPSLPVAAFFSQFSAQPTEN